MYSNIYIVWNKSFSFCIFTFYYTKSTEMSEHSGVQKEHDFAVFGPLDYVCNICIFSHHLSCKFIHYYIYLSYKIFLYQWINLNKYPKLSALIQYIWSSISLKNSNMALRCCVNDIFLLYWFLLVYGNAFDRKMHTLTVFCISFRENICQYLICRMQTALMPWQKP